MNERVILLIILPFFKHSLIKYHVSGVLDAEKAKL